MSGMKEISLEELEKICGGADKNFLGLTPEEMQEFNDLLKECYDTILAKQRDKLPGLIAKLHDFKNAHPAARDHVAHIIEIVKDIWLRLDTVI